MYTQPRVNAQKGFFPVQINSRRINNPKNELTFSIDTPQRKTDRQMGEMFVVVVSNVLLLCLFSFI